MNKRKLVVMLFVFGLLSSSTSLFASELCFEDSFGDFFRLTGGNIGNKAFAAEWLSQGCGSVAGLATTMRDSQGNVLLAIQVPYSGSCSAVVWSFVGNRSLSFATGNYNNFPRTVGPYTADALIEISCSSVPPASSFQQNSRLVHTPGKEN